MNKLSYRSRRELKGVHADLVIVVTTALITLEDTDFSVHDGIRTLAEQQELVATGMSKTLKSRHLTGHAVDLVPVIDGTLCWDSKEPKKQEAIDKAFESIDYALNYAAKLHNVPVENGFAMWGWDKPHWQLPVDTYPAS